MTKETKKSVWLMERRMRWKSHVRCEAGEKLEITSKAYLSLLHNLQRLNAAALMDDYQVLILAPISVDEMKKIIDSIYEWGFDNV